MFVEVVSVSAVLRTEVSVVDKPPSTALTRGGQTKSRTPTVSIRSKAWYGGSQQTCRYKQTLKTNIFFNK